MATLNFKHLRYFWTVSRYGSIAQASIQLNVTPQSISAQLSELEISLNSRLFSRVGRGLQLTDMGRRLMSYADEIFGLEEELLAVVRDQSRTPVLPFRVGIADSVPKSLSYHLLEPALHLDESIRLFCKEGRLESMLSDLSVNRLDMVIADKPMPPDVKVRAFNHFLGESSVTVFGAPQLLKVLKGNFPEVLDNAPFLMPGSEVAIRGALERWFEDQRLSPRVIGEFDDGALLKAFGQGGAGLFVAPTAISDYLCRQYSVRAIGCVEAVKEQLFAITTERRMQHPAAVMVREAASRDVFGRVNTTETGASHRAKKSKNRQ